MTNNKISSNVVWQQSEISRSDRENMNQHRGAVLWFAGLSGSGKSTLAHAVEKRLYQISIKHPAASSGVLTAFLNLLVFNQLSPQGAGN